LVVTLAVLLVLVLSLRGIAAVFTDYLWFDELGRTDVWTKLLRARLFPATVAVLATFVVMIVSLTVAERLAPTFRYEGPEDEITARYRSFVSPFAGRLRVGISALFALAVGANAGSEWRSWLLFQNSVNFGEKDAQFHKDISFYVFRLPFINFVLGLIFAALVVTFIVTLVSHYLNGGIRLQTPFQRVTPQVKAHLSVLLALMALVKTAQYWFARYDLVFSRRGTRDGALYTDLKVQLPAYNLLVFIAIIAAVLFLVNIWQRGWALPIIAVVLWGFVSVVVGSIVPAFTQKYSVENSELDKERPYIKRNIEATRKAFGLDAVEQESFKIDASLDESDATAGRVTLDAARVWDPFALESQFQEQQGFRSFYTFNDLDVDRYQFGDEYTPVIVGTRDLDSNRLPSDSWLTRHLIYTHGSGAVIAAADDAKGKNASYRLEGIPPEGESELEVDEDRRGIYYGEGLSGFVVVKSNEREIEAKTSREDGDGTVVYGADGGVQADGFIRKSALALRFWDRNLFLSSSITSESRVMWVRDPRERVEKIAPFLKIESDAYPVVVGGRVSWIVDGYTTTDRYPYSQAMTLDDATIGGAAGLDEEFNYIRNSVKAVVDAYDGSVTLYEWDTDDPMLKAWRKVFPGLVRDRSEVPDELDAHFRYPAELFAVQTQQFAEYHVTDPDDFYGGSLSWQIASTATNPASSAPASATSDSATADSAESGDGGRSSRASKTKDPMESLYQVLQLPGESAPEFTLSRSFVPVGKENRLQSFFFARSDPEHYGELVVYQIDGDAASPVLASQRIQNDSVISPQVSLLKGKGSDLEFGEMRVLPIGDSLLYLQPFYIKGEGSSSFLLLQGVALSDGENAVLEGTFEEALAALLGTSPTDPDDPPPDDATVPELLAKAQAAFEDADAAAAKGDYEEQGRQLALARGYVADAAELTGLEPVDGSTTTTSPSGTTTTTTPATTSSPSSSPSSSTVSATSVAGA
jgi:uncharacterized membrane protein (UPF0182 family)